MQRRDRKRAGWELSVVSESKAGLDDEAEVSWSEATAEAVVGGPEKNRGLEESGFLPPPRSAPTFQLKGGSRPKRKGES